MPAERYRRSFLRMIPFRPILLCGAAIIALSGASVPVRAETAVPDFNGNWGHNNFSYLKPYLDAKGNVIDGYDNAYVKPWVVEQMTRSKLVEAAGRSNAADHTICYPESIPGEFGGREMQILQTPTEIMMLFGDTNHSREIHLNRPHPEHVVPSWFGDAVGHFEGDELVVDTIGLAVHPEALSTSYGTPHTVALHVVERYRFLKDGEKPAPPRPGNDRNNGLLDPHDMIAGGRILRLTFTVDDPGAYKQPWSESLDYHPLKNRLREFVCAENNRDLAPLMPTAEVPDF
jgi:hypothetical protein